MGRRLERAKGAAVLAAKTLGAAGTIAALALLWRALHAAEGEGFDDGDAD